MTGSCLIEERHAIRHMCKNDRKHNRIYKTRRVTDNGKKECLGEIPGRQ